MPSLAATPLRLLPLFALAPLFAATTPPTAISFENGVPPECRAVGGTITTVTGSPKDGTQALRWDFSAGDTLEISTGEFGPVNISSGYGGYSHSAFESAVNLTRAGTGKIVIELRSGTQVAGIIEVPLVHAGWQKLTYHYSWNSAITWKNASLKPKLDNIRFVAVDTPDRMTVLLDAIQPNVQRDFRDGRRAITQAWSPKAYDFSKEPAPSAAELAAMEKLATSLLPGANPGLSRAHWEKRLAAIRKMVAEKHYKKGHPISPALADTLVAIDGIASDWIACADPEMRDAIAAEFLAMNDWLQDQGLVVDGAVGKANNYIGRAYVDAVAKMREPLARAGALDTSLAYIKWSYDYDDRLFGKEGGSESMDYFHNEAFRFLRIALMHGDPVTRWHHVARFRRVIGNQLVDTVKPDGSIFHHGFHYFAYGTMGMGSISGVLNKLSAAGLPVEERALDAAKHGVMTMRRYAGGDAVLLSLCGRHPGGKQMLNAGTFITLANAYAPYRGGKPDAELAAAYLRLAPREASKPEFAGITPEKAPQGFYPMPFAGLASHRRDHWLAGVKGFGKNISAGESYANANRFGLYLSNGFLELHTHPLPLPNVLDSGCHPDEGWNWCAPDGTTTIHAPLQVIANGNGTQSEYGSETFVGGLAHEGGNGAFALTINSGMQAARTRAKGAKGGPFTARKSYFFFDNRIVCLGSGIGVDGVDHPVRTTLFQKFVTDTHNSVRIGAEILALPCIGGMTRDLPGASVITDPYGNTYFSRDAVHLTLGQQTSRDGYDQRDTKGEYATAWIDHGANPRDAGYEYAVLVQAKPAQTAALQSGAAPYRVLARDAACHVVTDTATGTTGYAVFDAKANLAPLNTRILGVEQPCLIMLNEHGNKLVLSITDPAPRPEAKTPAMITVRIAGKLKPGAPLPAGSSVQESDTETRVGVPVLHGESVTVHLESELPKTLATPAPVKATPSPAPKNPIRKMWDSIWGE